MAYLHILHLRLLWMHHQVYHYTMLIKSHVAYSQRDSLS